MTRVCFRVNLGSVDAERLGIANFRECVAEAEVDVPDPAAEALEKAGIVSLAERSKSAKSAELKADPTPETDLNADAKKKK